MARRSRFLLVAATVWALLAAGTPPAARGQYVPYFGKNKVKYGAFAWRIYRSPHFEVYYYPEFEEHLARVVSYAESAYLKISGTLKHTIGFPIPLVLYKTHSDFEQTSLFPSFIPEGVAAFAEPSRHRMVLPIDEAPDRLNGLVTHELTHIFEFDLIPRGIGRREVPLWIDEGLADYMRETWDPLDLMTIRDAALTDQIPRLSRLENLDSGSPRLVYNIGHAAFEFVAARFGKEGVRQFLYTLRKNYVGGGSEEIFQQAFRLTPAEFDDAFDKWLKERFKPLRDKQPAGDYGRDLAPDAEGTVFSQVYAFSPSPSGELIAAVTANRADGEADVVLLSAKDGSIVRNLTRGYTGKYENISLSDGFTAGRSIAFDPAGDLVAFVARTGKGRSLFLVSALSGKLVRRLPLDLDLPQGPCVLPQGKGVLLAGIKDGVSDIFLLDLGTGRLTNLTQDAFRDADPQVSPDGALVVYTRRISGNDKIMAFPLEDPSAKTQLTFGAHDDLTPVFSLDGKKLFYASNENDDILNIRSLDLATGVIRQYTDASGGTMTPAALGREPERVAFISYHKGVFRLQALELGEPLAEPDQDVEVAAVDSVDFEPDVVHQVLPENKRGKRLFEKFTLDGRPPLALGVTSGGDFFGGSQLVFADVLGDKNLVLSAFSEREYRTYDATFVNLSHRLHWGLTGFDMTVWGYADPYGYLDYGFSRQGALIEQRLTGGQIFGVYPLDKLRRLEVYAGALREWSGFPSSEAQAFVEQQAALYGLPVVLRKGTTTVAALRLVQETTRFHEFGPLSGSTFLLGAEVAPGWGHTFSRLTFELDARKYLRLTPGVVFATRVRAFRSTGDDPDYFFFGGDMELRGYDYRSFSGNEGFHANAELRFPLIDVMKTPIGLLGPLRGTLFGGVGGARWKGERFQFATRAPGRSYVNDSVFGEEVTGYRLVDGRASVGAGLQFFFLGYPLHFDWCKLTDLKVFSKQTYFKFWIGFDF